MKTDKNWIFGSTVIRAKTNEKFYLQSWKKIIENAKTQLKITQQTKSAKKPQKKRRGRPPSLKKEQKENESVIYDSTNNAEPIEQFTPHKIKEIRTTHNSLFSTSSQIQSNNLNVSITQWNDSQAHILSNICPQQIFIKSVTTGEIFHFINTNNMSRLIQPSINHLQSTLTHSFHQEMGNMSQDITQGFESIKRKFERGPYKQLNKCSKKQQQHRVSKALKTGEYKEREAVLNTLLNNDKELQKTVFDREFIKKLQKKKDINRQIETNRDEYKRYVEKYTLIVKKTSQGANTEAGIIKNYNRTYKTEDDNIAKRNKATKNDEYTKRILSTEMQDVSQYSRQLGKYRTKPEIYTLPGINNKIISHIPIVSAIKYHYWTLMTHNSTYGGLTDYVFHKTRYQAFINDCIGRPYESKDLQDPTSLKVQPPNTTIRSRGKHKIVTCQLRNKVNAGADTIGNVKDVPTETPQLTHGNIQSPDATVAGISQSDGNYSFWNLGNDGDGQTFYFTFWKKNFDDNKEIDDGKVTIEIELDRHIDVSFYVEIMIQIFVQGDLHFIENLLKAVQGSYWMRIAVHSQYY
eukprot:198687_1